MALKGILEKPRGLVYRSDFLTVEEERRLLEFIKLLEFQQVVMHGQAAKRVVCHFGLGYDFESRQTTPGESIPKQLIPLRLKAEKFADLPRGAIVEALITKYPVGSTIGWHRDAPPFGVVIGISLLAPVIMRFRRGEGTERRVYERILNPRSAYILQGQVRSLWQHHIPPTKRERYSVTFRTLKV